MQGLRTACHPAWAPPSRSCCPLVECSVSDLKAVGKQCGRHCWLPSHHHPWCLSARCQDPKGVQMLVSHVLMAEGTNPGAVLWDPRHSCKSHLPCQGLFESDLMTQLYITRPERKSSSRKEFPCAKKKKTSMGQGEATKPALCFLPEFGHRCLCYVKSRCDSNFLTLRESK